MSGKLANPNEGKLVSYVPMNGGNGSGLDDVKEDDRESEGNVRQDDERLMRNVTTRGVQQQQQQPSSLSSSKENVRPKLSHAPLSMSESSFTTRTSLSNKRNILPNKLNLKSMTIDSSKEYSTSSSSSTSSSEDSSSSSELGNSSLAKKQSVSTSAAAAAAAPTTTSVGRKKISQNLSIDEQSSNGIMMVAPLGSSSPPPATESTSSAAVVVVSTNDDMTNETEANNQVASSAATTDQYHTLNIKSASSVGSSSSSPLPSPSPTPVHSNLPLVDMSMFDFIDNTSRQFVLKPASAGFEVKCQIYRQKGIISPEYKFYLENVDSNLLLLMSARKKKKSKTTCYVISSIKFDLNDLEKYDETPLAKLKSNLLGTNFSLYDFGSKPPLLQQQQQPSVASPLNKSSNNTKENNMANLQLNQQQQQQPAISNSPSSASLPKSDSSSCTHKCSSLDQSSDIVTTISDEMPSPTATSTYRKEYLSVSYEMNVLGMKGPRQMCVVMPGMDAKCQREDFVQLHATDTLSSAWKKTYARMKPPSSKSLVTAAAAAAAAATTAAVATTTTTESLSAASAASAAAAAAATGSGCESPILTSKPNFSKLSSIRRSLFQLNSTQSIEKSMDSATTTTTTNKYRNVIKLINKSPEWNKELGSFALNFHGRVAMSSVKNFQIVHEANADYVCMQFGKINKDLYTCDYSYPFCALQAFALALTSLDNKLGCD